MAGLTISCLYLFSWSDFTGGLNSPNAITGLDLGQIARRVSRGDGFVTGFIRPVSLRYSSELLVHPELAHPPLYIIVLSLVFRVWGANSPVLVACSAVCFFLSAFLALIWSRRWFEPRVVALGLFLILINPVLLEDVLAAGPGLCAGLLAILFFPTLEKARSSKVASLGAGILIGLAYLIRYSYGLWIIPGLFSLFFSDRETRPSRMGLLIVGMIVTIAPWQIRNLIVVGAPFFSLEGFRAYMFSSSAPGYMLWRGFSPQSLAVDDKFLILFKKLLLGIRDIWHSALFFTGNLAAVFTLGSVLVEARDRFARFRQVFIFMLGLEIFYQMIFSPEWNGLVALVPAGLILSSAVFWRLVSPHPVVHRRVALFLLLALCAIPLGRPLFPVPNEKGIVYDLENITESCRVVGEKGIMVSDIPWAVAWYGDRNCIWLPAYVGDYEEIKLAYDPPLEAFYITGFYFGSYFSPEERGPNWEKMLNSGWLPAGWNLNNRAILEGGQLLLSLKPLEPKPVPDRDDESKELNK